MSRSSKILLTAIGIAGVGAATYYFLKREEIQNKSKEKAAMEYLKEVYGEEALAGKKLVLIDENDYTDKTDIAKDVIDYEVHAKE